MKDFNIIYFTQNRELYTEELIEKMIKSQGKVLKDDSRSFVKLIEINGEKFIIKQPKEKNRRRWIRFTTLFREGEVVSVLKTMKILNENGIKTNLPIVCLEKRKFGMIVDSYAVYKYIDGKEAEEKDVKDLLEKLKSIHEMGYLHGDTQAKNFIVKDNEILIIDSNLKKKRYGKISEYLEYLELSKDLETVSDLMEKNSVWYKLAKLYFNTQIGIRRLKKNIRIKLGLRKTK